MELSKKPFLILFVLFFIGFVSAANFTSQWDTTLVSTGSSTSAQIKLPLEVGGEYNFTVYWGDGSFDEITSWNQTEVTHTYSSPGNYTLDMDGIIVGFRFNNGGDKLKILNIESWGDLNLGNSGYYFYGCSNLNSNATDALNLTGTLFLNYTFASCTNFNGSIGNWNTSSVTSMSSMFYSASSFNQDIGNWDVSKVSTMTLMFLGVTLSTPNYDSLLMGWLNYAPLKTGVSFDAGDSEYLTGGDARQTLIDTYSWSISDGGAAPGITTFFGDSTPETNSCLKELPIEVNTLSAKDISLIEIFVYNSSGLVISNSSPSSSFSWNVSGLNSGIYYFNSSAVNINGVMNFTETRTIILDSDAPLVSFISPTPDNESIRSSFEINVSLTEEKIKNLLYEWNNTNYTIFSNNLILMMNLDNISDFNETETMAADISNNQNNGTIVGASWDNAGKFGSALSFNGLDNYLNLSENSADFGGFLEGAISMWFKTNSSSVQTLFSLSDNTEDSNYAVLYLGPSSEDYEDESIMFQTNLNEANSLTMVTREGNYAYMDGEWHHLLLVIDGVDNKFYIDGEEKLSYFSSGSASTASFTNIGSTPNSLLIGQRDIKFGGSNYLGNFFNGSIDEIRIWNSTFSSDEAAFFYNSNLKKYSSEDWILESEQKDLASGQVYSYEVFAEDLVGNTNSSERFFIIGNSAPRFISINNSPNLEDELDPNEEITIQVNISEIDLNLASVVLQYKNSSSDWTNLSMNNLTEFSSYTLFEAKFTPDVEDIWTYRIFAEDTEQGINMSSENNVSVYWDCSWTITSDLGETAGWDQNKNIGIIVINNTGDLEFANNNGSLDFRLNYDLAEGRIYFDSFYLKPSNTYTVPAETSLNISVNATFLSEIKQEDVLISITEVYNSSGDYNKTTTTTLITNQVGPYLYQKITDYPLIVELVSGDTFNLSGYLRNLMGSSSFNENNTAYNVSFNWTLPSGLAIDSGNLVVDYENLTDNNLNENTVEVKFEDLSSMSAGAQTFYLYSQGYDLDGNLISNADGNEILVDIINITFLCSSVPDGVYVSSCGSLDGDYVAPTPTVSSVSSGGGGGGSSSKKSLFDETKDKFELLLGKEQAFVLPIENTYKYDKIDLSLSVSGINSEYITINPKIIPRVNSSSSENVSVIINAPAYFTEASYLLEFTIKGKVVFNKTIDFTEKKYVRLYFIEIPREKAEEYLNFSNLILEDMKNKGLFLDDALGHFNLINGSFLEVDYTSVEKSYKSLVEIYDSALESIALLNELKENIAKAEERGIDVFETKKLVYVAETIFNRGNYLYSYEKLNEAKLSYALEVKGEFNILYEIKNHPLEFSGFLFSLVLLVFAFTTFIRMTRLKKKNESLIKEEQIILGLMRVIQKDTFEGGKMSMEEYGSAMSQYEKKLNKVISDRIKVQSKLSNFLSLKGKRKALEEERNELKKLIEETQRKYLSEGSLDTRIYQNILKTYSSRLVKVDEELVFLEAKSFLKSKKKREKFFIEKSKKPEKKKKIDKRIKKVRKEIKLKEKSFGKKSVKKIKNIKRELRKRERRDRIELKKELKKNRLKKKKGVNKQ